MMHVPFLYVHKAELFTSTPRTWWIVYFILETSLSCCRTTFKSNISSTNGANLGWNHPSEPTPRNLLENIFVILLQFHLVTTVAKQVNYLSGSFYLFILIW